MSAYRPPATHRTSRLVALAKGTSAAGFAGPPVAPPPPRGAPAPSNPYGAHAPQPLMIANITGLRPGP